MKGELKIWYFYVENERWEWTDDGRSKKQIIINKINLFHQKKVQKFSNVFLRQMFFFLFSQENASWPKKMVRARASMPAPHFFPSKKRFLHEITLSLSTIFFYISHPTDILPSSNIQHSSAPFNYSIQSSWKQISSLPSHLMFFMVLMGLGAPKCMLSKGKYFFQKKNCM